MKKFMLLAAFFIAAQHSFAQDETTVTITHGAGDKGTDTIKVGGMIIIKKGDGKETRISTKKPHVPNHRLQTSWLLLDLGFSNLNNQTNFGSADALAFTGNVPFNASDFALNTGKSFDINVWIVRQRYGLTRKNHLNLTYGLVLETKNYRYENNISYLKGGPPYVKKDNIEFKKNKLATSYITLPVMIGFNTKPASHKGFIVNAGVSMGYLYSSRNKQISDDRGRQKIKGNFNLEPWKFQVIAEAGFRTFKIYGAYSPNSMFKSGLDMRPYSFGVRLGGWD